MQAQWSGRTRSFFMATLNNGSPKDDYALAQSLELGYVSKAIHGFRLGAKSYYIQRLASSDLAAADPITGKPNRYEVSLFDLTTKPPTYSYGGLSEAYLQYQHKHSTAIFGRQKLNTPLVHPQDDGRMRGNTVAGFWMKSDSLGGGFSAQGGWLLQTSPRSTNRFYAMGESMGLYNAGVGSDGKPSAYAGNVHSQGLGIAQLAFQRKAFKAALWEYYFDNVLNIVLGEASGSRALRDTAWQVFGSAMLIQERAIGEGGNTTPALRYIAPNARTSAASTQLGLRCAKMQFTLNGTVVSGERLLVPREWGRDPFYTFLARERTEGCGNVQAMSARMQRTLYKNRLQCALAYGYYHLPDVRDFAQNKYGLPSYHHLNIEANYAFGSVLRGANMRLLLVGKAVNKHVYHTEKYLYNKANLLHMELVFDYAF